MTKEFPVLLDVDSLLFPFGRSGSSGASLVPANMLDFPFRKKDVDTRGQLSIVKVSREGASLLILK